MDFEKRCSPDSGNMLLSYTVKEDEEAMKRGFKFMGVCKDSSGSEVHVFEKQQLEVLK